MFGVFQSSPGEPTHGVLTYSTGSSDEGGGTGTGCALVKGMVESGVVSTAEKGAEDRGCCPRIRRSSADFHDIDCISDVLESHISSRVSPDENVVLNGDEAARVVNLSCSIIDINPVPEGECAAQVIRHGYTSFAHCKVRSFEVLGVDGCRRVASIFTFGLGIWRGAPLQHFNWVSKSYLGRKMFCGSRFTFQRNRVNLNVFKKHRYPCMNL